MTIDTMQTILDAATVAYQSALVSKSTTFTEDGVTRQTTRQDLNQLLITIQFWETQIAKAKSGRGGLNPRFITPVF